MRWPTTIETMGRNDPDAVRWPAHWQTEAIEAVRPYVGSKERLRIVRDDPETAIDGTVLEGHVYIEDGTPMMIFDRSGKPDVFPWKLMTGPVLRVELIRPRKQPLLVYAHPDWVPHSR
jgi:hypothetical protein